MSPGQRVQYVASPPSAPSPIAQQQVNIMTIRMHVHVYEYMYMYRYINVYVYMGLNDPTQIAVCMHSGIHYACIYSASVT